MEHRRSEQARTAVHELLWSYFTPRAPRPITPTCGSEGFAIDTPTSAYSPAGPSRQSSMSGGDVGAQGSSSTLCTSDEDPPSEPPKHTAHFFQHEKLDSVMAPSPAPARERSASTAAQPRSQGRPRPEAASIERDCRARISRLPYIHRTMDTLTPDKRAQYLYNMSLDDDLNPYLAWIYQHPSGIEAVQAVRSAEDENDAYPREIDYEARGEAWGVVKIEDLQREAFGNWVGWEQVSRGRDFEDVGPRNEVELGGEEQGKGSMLGRIRTQLKRSRRGT